MDIIPIYVPEGGDEIQISFDELNQEPYTYCWCNELLQIIQNLINQHPDTSEIHLFGGTESLPMIYDGYILTNEGKVSFECEDSDD